MGAGGCDSRRLPGGGLRPLGVASLEDKILQRAVVEVLNAVYELGQAWRGARCRPSPFPRPALRTGYVEFHITGCMSRERLC